MRANEQRKKERVLKMKVNNEVSDEIKAAIDPVYRQTVEHLETAAANEKEAREIIKKNLS